MFIGREKELALLQQDYIGKAVMVYGKRRVGKTTLIQKALKSSSYRTVYFECLKGTMQDNINGLVRELVRAKLLPVPLNFSTLQDVFAYLNALPEKIIVVIDEYPYLKAMNDSATVDSIFQNIIDNRLANVELILSGSHIGMMKDTLQEKNALYGRFAVTIKLNELNYLEAAKTMEHSYVRTELSRIFLTDLYEGSKKARVYAENGDASDFLEQWLGKYESIEALQELVKKLVFYRN